MYPDIYADILNALAYAGSRVVRAEALMPAPTESFYYVGRGRLSNQFSDASMYEKLHIYSMMHLPKRIRNRFRSDMRIVLDFLAERKDYQPTDQKIVHLEAFMLMLGALTKDNRYLRLLKAVQEEEREKGGITMCELLDKYWNSGIETGMKQGMKQGIDQGEARLSSLNEKLFNLNRIEDVRKAASSKRYRNRLYKEFGII